MRLTQVDIEEHVFDCRMVLKIPAEAYNYQMEFRTVS